MALPSSTIKTLYGFALLFALLAVWLFVAAPAIPTRVPGQYFQFAGLSRVLLGGSPAALAVIFWGLASERWERDSVHVHAAMAAAFVLFGVAVALAEKV